jgi:hypothetical protein
VRPMGEACKTVTHTLNMLLELMHAYYQYSSRHLH